MFVFYYFPFIFVLFWLQLESLEFFIDVDQCDIADHG